MKELRTQFAWLLFILSIIQLVVLYLGFALTLEGSVLGLAVWVGIVVFYLFTDGNFWILLVVSISFCGLINGIVLDPQRELHWFTLLIGAFSCPSGAVGLLSTGVYLRNIKSDGV